MASIFVINDKDLPSIESISLSKEIGRSNPNNNSEDGERNPQQLLVNNECKKLTTNEPSNKNKEHPTSPNVNGNENITNKKTNSRRIIEENKCNDELSHVETMFGLVATNKSLDGENIFHRQKACKREETFISILMNEDNEMSYQDLIAYPIGISFIGFSSTLMLSLIPFHDLVQFSEYWYEIVFQGLVIVTCTVAFECFRAGLVLNIRCISRLKNMLFVLIAQYLLQSVLIILSYYLWTAILDYYYPIPFFGYLMYIEFTLILLLFNWKRFPMEYRCDEKFRKRVITYYFYVFFALSLIVIYQLIIEVIRRSNVDYQPFVALALPLMRELTLWTGLKLIGRCSNGEQWSHRV